MESNKRYRPLFQLLQIGKNQYPVLLQDAAKERVCEHLNNVQQLMQDSPWSSEIDRELVLATDFGSKDAPFMLAQRILDPRMDAPYQAEEAVIFLKVAAERGHAEAAYQLGSSYAGMGRFRNIEQAACEYFSDFEFQERARLAEYYFNLAIESEHPNATEDLIIAYAYGRGLIHKNADQFIGLCEMQIQKKNQSVQLGYGAWLSGMTVEGEEPLSTAIKIPLDTEKGLELLLQASRGKNLHLAQHSLHLICLGFLQNQQNKNSFGGVSKRLIHDALRGNQLLALYLAWYSIPLVQRSLMPRLLETYQLSQLSFIIPQHEENAILYLDKAIFGQDEDVSNVAREMMTHVFGKCFMDDDGLIVLAREAG